MYYSDAVDDRGIYLTWLEGQYDQRQLSELADEILGDCGFSSCTGMCQTADAAALALFIADNSTPQDNALYCRWCMDNYESEDHLHPCETDAERNPSMCHS
jgi:hypothetical protein